jgi:branched-chain amino acid transport system ATP-binding protein
MRYLGTTLRGGSAERVRRGISYAAGGRAVLAGLTVAENLGVAADVVGAARRQADERRAFVYGLFPDLARLSGLFAGNLSGGQQRMLAVSMAVIQRPSLLLLDEPSLGLSPLLTTSLYRSISTIRRELGLTVLVVEQSTVHAEIEPNSVYVMRMGTIVYNGGPEVLGDPERLWGLM